MDKSVHILLLLALVLLSIFELDGYFSAVLFLFIAGLLGLIANKNQNLVPPVIFVIVAYIFGFPMGILFPDFYPELWRLMPSDVVQYAMLWALRGFCAFALGYVLIERLGVRSRNPQSKAVTFSGNRMHYTVYLFTSIGWLATLAWILSVLLFGISLTFIEGIAIAADTATGTLVQILTLVNGLREPFFLGFYVLYYWKQTNRHLFYLFLALLLITIVEIIAIGSKATIIRAVVLVLLTLAVLPIQLSRKQILVGVFALAAIYVSFSIVTEYRAIVRSDFMAGRDVFDFSVQADAFGNALIAILPSSEATAYRETIVETADVLSRFGSGIFSFGNLLEVTGRQSPYEYAWENILIPIYSFVPRTLLPDKPEFFGAGRNASDYFEWTYGGISVSLLGSLYFAWGYAGIIVGMALLGGYLAYVVGKVNQFGLYAPHWMILLPALMMPMMDVGMTVQDVAINSIRLAALLWLLRMLYSVRRYS